MRYTREHKARTRERILEHAARLFRRHGYDGVGIDEIMAAADLTRGGFYAHFRSKAELFAAVMAMEHGFVRKLRARSGARADALMEEALQVVAGYLAPENRERIGRGCHMAALSVDAARAGARVRRGFRENFRNLAAEFARGMPGADPEDPRILASIALCVGAVILGRALDDEELVAELLGASHRLVARTLTSPASPGLEA
jgi:TetR/AcrR family transcriptional repressor of nem operon